LASQAAARGEFFSFRLRYMKEGEAWRRRQVRVGHRDTRSSAQGKRPKRRNDGPRAILGIGSWAILGRVPVPGWPAARLNTGKAALSFGDAKAHGPRAILGGPIERRVRGREKGPPHGGPPGPLLRIVSRMAHGVSRLPPVLLPIPDGPPSCPRRRRRSYWWDRHGLAV
jgi:hypothetical protein